MGGMIIPTAAVTALFEVYLASETASLRMPFNSGQNPAILTKAKVTSPVHPFPIACPGLNRTGERDGEIL